MSGMLGHIEDAAIRVRAHAQGAAELMGAPAAGAVADKAADKARAFAEEHGVPFKYVDLSIQFIGADGIPQMDINGTADPYFHADIDGRKTFKCVLRLLDVRPVLRLGVGLQYRCRRRSPCGTKCGS
jgi:hypothetical protein